MTSGQICVVLAGGLGTRLQSVISNVPKVLAPVNGRPFLSFLLDHLADHGVSRFVLSLGHLSDQVVREVSGWNSSVEIDYVCEITPLGTGGAVFNAMATYGISECLVANGDTFLNADISPLFADLRAHEGELMRIAAIRVDDRSRYGGLETDGEHVVSFSEKGRSDPGLISTGLYRVGIDAFRGVSNASRFSLEVDVMEHLASRRSLTFSEVIGDFIDIGIPQDYHAFCKAALSRPKR